MKRLIVTGDDFGASLSVNRAIEQAHVEGILNTTSLMVGADAAEDAVRRARALPDLNVGLHLVLVCGRPVLPPAEIPDLVGPDGAFSTRLVRTGFRMFFLPHVRRQLAAEIRAQFDRFQATGLTLDHVNAHNHMHLHPSVLGLILAIGPAYGMGAVRVPHEPFLASWRAAGGGLGRRLATDLLLRPLIAIHRTRIRRARIACNDYVFGLNDTGTMDRERVMGFLRHLPEGVSEIYCHPALGPWEGVEPAARHYRFADELAAMTDAGVGAALERLGIDRTSFGRLAAERAR